MPDVPAYPTPEPSQQKPARSRWGSILRWVPVVVVIAELRLPRRARSTSAQLKASLLDVTLWPLALAIVLSTLSTVAHAAYWRVMVGAFAPVTLGAMTTYTFASYATNAFLPMRAGEGLRVLRKPRAASATGVPITTSAAIIALEKVADTMSLLILVSPLPWLIPDLPASIGKALRILPCIVLGGALAVVIAGRHSTRWSFLRGFGVVNKPGVIAGGAACVLLAWLLDTSCILACLGAVHVAPTLDKALVVILLVNIAVSIPATPGQVGAHELGSTFALRLVGVPEAEAIPFALFYHATQLIPVLVIGLSTAKALSKSMEGAEPVRESAATRQARPVPGLAGRGTTCNMRITTKGQVSIPRGFARKKDLKALEIGDEIALVRGRQSRAVRMPTVAHSILRRVHSVTPTLERHRPLRRRVEEIRKRRHRPVMQVRSGCEERVKVTYGVAIGGPDV